MTSYLYQYTMMSINYSNTMYTAGSTLWLVFQTWVDLSVNQVRASLLFLPVSMLTLNAQYRLI